MSLSGSQTLKEHFDRLERATLGYLRMNSPPLGGPWQTAILRNCIAETFACSGTRVWTCVSIFPNTQIRSGNLHRCRSAANAGGLPSNVSIRGDRRSRFRHSPAVQRPVLLQESSAPRYFAIPQAWFSTGDAKPVHRDGERAGVCRVVATYTNATKRQFRTHPGPRKDWWAGSDATPAPTPHAERQALVYRALRRICEKSCLAGKMG
jgi:hypothetical protein